MAKNLADLTGARSKQSNGNGHGKAQGNGHKGHAPMTAARTQGSQPKPKQQPAMAGTRGQPVQQKAGARPAPKAPVQQPIDPRHIGRNDPCYCGSGKKYKLCHGK